MNMKIIKKKKKNIKYEMKNLIKKLNCFINFDYKTLYLSMDIEKIHQNKLIFFNYNN